MNKLQKFQEELKKLNIQEDQNLKLEEILEFEDFNKENTDYFIYKKIAEGGSSKVYLARSKNRFVNKIDRVVKLFFKNNDSSSFSKHMAHYEEGNYFARAAEMQYNLRQLNFIPAFINFGQLKNEKYYLIEEYIEGKNLSKLSKESLPNFIEIKQMNSEEYKSKIINKIMKNFCVFDHLIRDLKYLHLWITVIHRDIKLENIIYNEKTRSIHLLDWHIAEKLPYKKKFEDDSINSIDLDNTKIIDDVYGSRLYTPPEKFLTGESSVKTDMYALGICMYKFLTGEYPFFNEEVSSNQEISSKRIKEFMSNKIEYKNILNERINHLKNLYYTEKAYEKSLTENINKLIFSKIEGSFYNEERTIIRQ